MSYSRVFVFFAAAWRISKAFGGSVAVLIEADKAIAFENKISY